MKVPPNSPEFANFTNAMRSILTVSKVELNAREEVWKKEQKLAKRKRERAKAKADKARAAKTASRNPIQVVKSTE
jgi:hypothetical protein